MRVIDLTALDLACRLAATQLPPGVTAERVVLRLAGAEFPTYFRARRVRTVLSELTGKRSWASSKALAPRRSRQRPGLYCVVDSGAGALYFRWDTGCLRLYGCCGLQDGWGGVDL